MKHDERKRTVETTQTSSKLAILAIVYKAVKTVGDEYEMKLRDQAEIAEMLGEKMVEALALAGAGTMTEVQLQSTQLDVFDFFNDVLDLIEPQLPFVRKYFNVTLTTSRFSERASGDDATIPA
jgi:hypothetical protein